MRQTGITFGEIRVNWGYQEVTLISNSGLQVTCYKEYDLCQLWVKGDHFAATAGLLGVYDGEVNTDFMTSSWDMVIHLNFIIQL